MNKIIYILILICILTPLHIYAYNYPSLYSNGTNHTEFKEMVYSIPVEYYQFVDKIEILEYDKDWMRTEYMLPEEIRIGGMFATYNGNIDCFYTRIYFNGFPSNEVLIHELGHVYDICVRKNLVLTEEYANNFILDKY